jgi:hypothetical protein
MIRFGDSGWWLDQTAKGWVLCHVCEGRAGKL